MTAPASDSSLRDQTKEIKKLRQVLTVIAKLMIHTSEYTVGSEILSQELEKIK